MEPNMHQQPEHTTQSAADVGMTPLEAEIYNLAYEAGAGGLTSHDLHDRSQQAMDKTETIKAVRDLVEIGKLIAISHNDQRTYVAATAQNIQAVAADAERKKREKVIEKAAKSAAQEPPAPPPPRDIKGRSAAKKVEPKRATETDLHAAYAEGFDHGRMHACAVMAGVTDMPGEKALDHYWQISQAGRKERAA
jgi:hypothetical protein